MSTYDEIGRRPEPLFQKVLGQGTELLLVHGWGFHSEVWSDVQGVLAHRYRVTAVDLPGHGRSMSSALGHLDQAADRLCEQIGRPAIWVGWSLGAVLALAAASRHPELVRRVIAVAGTPRFVRDADWPHALAPEVLEGFADELERDFRRTLTRFLALQVRGAETGNVDLRRLRDLLFSRPPDRVALRDGLGILREADLRQCLSRLACPLRFILGERDALVPVSIADELGEGRVRVLRGAGHVPFLSHPTEFLRALDEALSD